MSKETDTVSDKVRIIVVNADSSWNFPLLVRQHALDLYPKKYATEFWETTSNNNRAIGADARDQQAVWGSWPRMFAGFDNQDYNSSFIIQSELRQSIQELPTDRHLVLMWVFNKPEDVLNSDNAINPELLTKIVSARTGDVVTADIRPRIWWVALFRSGVWDAEQRKIAHQLVAAEQDKSDDRETGLALFDTVFFISDTTEFKQSRAAAAKNNFIGLRIIHDVAMDIQKGRRLFVAGPSPIDKKQVKRVFWVQAPKVDETRPMRLRSLITCFVENDGGQQLDDQNKEQIQFSQDVLKLKKIIDDKSPPIHANDIVDFEWGSPFSNNRLFYKTDVISVNIEHQWQEHEKKIDTAYDERAVEIVKKVNEYQTRAEPDINIKIDNMLSELGSSGAGIVGADMTFINDIIEDTNRTKAEWVKKCSKTRENLRVDQEEENGYRSQEDHSKAPRYLKLYKELKSSKIQALYWSQNVLGRVEFLSYALCTFLLLLIMPLTHNMTFGVGGFFQKLWGLIDLLVLWGILPLVLISIGLYRVYTVVKKFHKYLKRVEADAADLGSRLGEVSANSFKFITLSTGASWLDKLRHRLFELNDNTKAGLFETQYAVAIKTNIRTTESLCEKFKKDMHGNWSKANPSEWMRILLPMGWLENSASEDVEFAAIIDDPTNPPKFQSSLFLDHGDVKFIPVEDK